MAGPRYSEDFKAQALAWVAQKVKPATPVAHELGIPRKTLYKWMEATRRHPTEPFVGSGHRRADDQAVDDLRRQIRNLQAENAIVKKAVRIFPHDPKCNTRSFRNPAATSRSRRGARAYRSPAAGSMPGATGRSVPRRGGERISRKTVAPVMAQQGWRSRVVRRYQATTNSRHNLPVADHVLAQQFVAPRPHPVWMGDITYMYLARLEDLYTRKIVGGAAGARMTPDLTLAALNQAVARYRPTDGGVHHSDRGSQDAAHAYPARLAHYHMPSRMSRQGNGWDKACIDSWHSLLKNECVYLHHFRTRAEAIAAIFAYIEIFYNRQRLHGALGYRPPAEAEAASAA